jgi:hypothetical protein
MTTKSVTDITSLLLIRFQENRSGLRAALFVNEIGLNKFNHELFISNVIEALSVHRIIIFELIRSR